VKIKQIGQGVNVMPMLWALQAHPELWDQNPGRTESPDSPHHELSDIWARYAKDATETGPHESVWYPCADLLPVRDLVYPLMTHVRGDQLGGVLITKIPPGKSCKPHRDPGWHARYYEKFAVQIQSSPGQKFCFEGEELEPMPGDVYWFDNAHTHWVTNPTPHDRITMIVCIKADRGA
jgi:hypothetical protein